MTITKPARLAAAALALAFAATAAFAQAPAPAQSGAQVKPASAKPAAQKAPRYFEKLAYPKLNDIKVPEVVQETLPNGLRLLLVEDHQFPMIQFRAVVRGGRLAEPKGKAGLAELFGEVQRTGGVKSMSGDKVDEFLERIGASIETNVDEAYCLATAKTLTEHLDKVLPLYAEFLIEPAFSQDKVDLAKTQLKGEIARRNDQVMQVAIREYLKLVYGKESPYARQFEYDDIEGLTRDDLVAMHTLCFYPDQTILAVWGDFKVPEMKEKLAKAFEKWPKGRGKTEFPEPFVFPPAPSVNYVNKTDVEQAFILLGHLSLRMDDPDYPAVIVLNDILGAGMSSRIFKEVREKRGLAYAAGGAIAPAYDHPGAVYVFSSTKPATMSQALSVIIEEIQKIQKEPVTDAEMKMAKEGYLNSYAFQFDSTAKVVQRMQTYLFYGYPLDFNKTLRDKVEKVTKDDVMKAAQKHLLPDALTILAIGKQEEWDKPLSTFGEVTTIDITIPEPKPKEVIPEATPEALAKGKQLLVAAARAAGEKALLDLKDMTSEGVTNAKTPMGEFELKGSSVFVLPDRLYTKMTTPMGDMVQVLDKKKAWMSAGGETRDLPGGLAGDMEKALWSRHGALLVLQAALQDKVKAQALGEVKFENKDAQDVLVTLPSGALRVYLSADGKEVLGVKRRGRTQSGPGDVIEVFTGYQAVQGLRVPFETRQDMNGETVATLKATSFKLNAGFSADLFAKPASTGEADKEE